MKATAIAPSNIAFIKYWGRKDEKLRLPSNGSISMNLSNLKTTTTVEFDSSLTEDDVMVNGIRNKEKGKRVSMHLDRIRKLAKLDSKAKVVSQNNFPEKTGLSSSASAFAALTLAAVKAANLSFSEKELTILSRYASGSSCRSIPDGFVEWSQGESSQTSYAYSIYPATWWDIVDIVAILDRKEKYIPTSYAQFCAYKSPFFETRLRYINKKIERCKNLIKERNFSAFGELIEEEVLELHAIIMTQKPPLLYLFPETIALMTLTSEWRASGIPVYFTLNTGHNIHLICEQKTVSSLTERLKKVKEVKEYIVNSPGLGARLIDDHLF